jgi:hypothetical protein
MEEKKCKICNSNKSVTTTELGDLCHKHYCQYKRLGYVKDRTKYDSNKIVLNTDGTAFIYLYDILGNLVDKAIIDREDVSKVSKYKWCKDNTGYAKSSNLKSLNRVILGEGIKKVRYINGNKLDNRKCNLKVVATIDSKKDNSISTLSTEAFSENERLKAIIIQIKKLCEETIDLLSSYKTPLTPMTNNRIDSLESKFNELVKELSNETN